MTENEISKIEPIKLKEFDTKQSKYPMVPQIPFISVILGPSGSGKTILLQNMILDIYKDCFSRIYIFHLALTLMLLGSLLKIYRKRNESSTYRR